MFRSFDNVDNKVAEAEFFLERLCDARTTFPEINWYLSAFLSAARSITFALQAVMAEVSGFETWYLIEREKLEENSLANYFVELRNFTQKTGTSVINRMSKNEWISMIRAAKDGHFVTSGHWFGNSGEAMPQPPKQSVAEACRSYFVTLLNLIYSCYLKFGPEIDPQQRYTPDYFSVVNKTIEDAEEELGYPRGWTDIGRPDLLPYRFELLRRQAGGCNINHIFLNYLNKTTPSLPPLPNLS